MLNLNITRRKRMGEVEEGNKWSVSRFVLYYLGQSAAGTHCVGGWLVYTAFVNSADKVKITSANNLPNNYVYNFKQIFLRY